MAQRRRFVAPGQRLGLDADVIGITAELTRVLREAVPDSLVIPELGLAGRRVRVDIAHVADRLSGFEIKGSRDDLHRLLHQEIAFSSTFQEMTLLNRARIMSA